jgi:glycosyltransferase involved in cell wall biosynthesis
VTVVGLIPAYEAAATIEHVVRGASAALPRVIVLDDGSTDGTSAHAQAAGAAVYRFEHNRGKGAVLQKGFALALEEGAQAIVTLDADGQHDPREIGKLLETWRATGAGLVIGSRESLADAMRPARRFGNRFSRKALSFFAGTDVPDGQSGFRLYDAELLRAVTLRGTRYELESEVIVKAARAGRRVVSVPVRLERADGKPTSHFRPWRDTARICTRVVFTHFFPS